MKNIQRNDFIDAFREAVLTAIDKHIEENYSVLQEGWKDSELPALFKAVDAQAKRCIDRLQNAAIIRVVGE